MPTATIVSSVTNKRKGGRKVKTGCLTCRVRRVKCDETKPGCLRCQKLGQECDGYLPGRRPLVVEKPWNNTSMQSVIFPRITTVILPQPMIGLIGDDQELRYFQLYQEHAQDINGPFTSDFWTRLVLQASHSNEAVRFAVVALGALHKTRESSQKSSNRIGSDALQKAHHEFALSQYQKAIQRLRETLETGQASPKVALITCLLFICFELFHGNFKAAMAQVLSGIHLLQEWTETSMDHLCNKESYLGTGDPIEDQLTQMFAQLDCGARTFMRQRKEPFESSCPTLVDQSSLDRLIPVVFSDLEEARYSFTMLTTRTMRLDARNGYNKYWPMSASQCQDLEEHIALLHSWDSAFAPILFRAQTDPRYKKELPGATVLKVHWMMSVIITSSTFDPEESYFDRHLEDFRQIVDYLRPIVAAANDAKASDSHQEAFSFEATTVAPLYLTATKCRDRSIRRQAIVLMSSVPRRECIFDSMMASKIALWIMGLEEQGVDRYGFVPEEARMKVSDVEFDMEGRTAVVTCGRRLIGMEDDFNVLQTKLSW